jgi:hypothetical protein
MRFGNPAALLLLLLVPLLLFTRRRAHTRLPVATLFLWQQLGSAETRSIAWRFRPHRLLMLQVAFLCAVALSAAKPFISVDGAPVALILDVSLSMGAREDGMTRLDRAKAQAIALVERLPRSTRIRILAAASQPRIIGEFEASDAAVRRALQSVRTTDAAGDLTGAIQFAHRSETPPRRIFVFSDDKRGQPAGISGVDVSWFTVGRASDNAAITDLSTRRSATPTVQTEVLVTVANFGTSALQAEVSVALDGTEVGRQPAYVPAERHAANLFTLGDVEGVLTARLEHDDALDADNVRRRIVARSPKIRVRRASPASVFLEQAMIAHPDVALVTSSADEYDIVVCDGCSAIPDGGQSVLFIPSRSRGSQNPAELVKIAEHPLTDGVELAGTSATPLGLPDLPGGRTIIALSNGVPGLVACEINRRRIVGFGMDPNSGRLPLGTAFPVLISNAIRWLANREGNPVALTAGEPLHWQLSGEEQQPVVVDPAGQSLPTTFVDGILSVVDTSTAGIYRLRLDSADRMIAVNPAITGEAELSAISQPARAADVASSQAGAEYNAEYQEVTVILALGALSLLALEWRWRLTGRVRG